MSNFLRSLFGAKKATKVNKSKMQSRRLELLGLEERVVPAISASFSGSTLLIAATGAETFTVSSSNTGQVTVSSATTVTPSGGVSIATGNVITVDSGASNVQVISITGDGAANQVVTLNDILSGGFNSNFGLSLSLGSAGADALTLSGTITLKGSGTLDTSTSDIETITLGSSSALALTSVSGLVKIDAGTATALNLGGNVTINSTSGNVTLADNVTSGGGNSLTINAGSGTVSTQGLGTSTGLGAVSLSSTATSNPSVLVTGLILSTGGLTLNGAPHIFNQILVPE
ncbi:hypothetical protein EBX93_07895 [bacterium]|nr:hypothetical protein [bacterium]